MDNLTFGKLSKTDKFIELIRYTLSLFGIDNIEKKEAFNNQYSNSPLANFPRGPIAGDCLHRILEKIDFNDIENQLKISTLSNLITDFLICSPCFYFIFSLHSFFHINLLLFFTF